MVYYWIQAMVLWINLKGPIPAFALLDFESWAWHMLGKHSAMELNPQYNQVPF